MQESKPINTRSKNDSPDRHCPKFSKCSVNACPLHADYPNIFVSPTDPETKCKAYKPTRINIAKQFPGVLDYSGLTVREHRRQVNRDSRTPEQIAKAREWGKKIAEIRTLRKSNQTGGSTYA